MSRMSLADYRLMSASGAKRVNKYNAKRTEVDGIWFDSKLEAARYVELRALEKSGHIAWFIRQVPFDLPGGIKYRADFLIVWHIWDPYQTRNPTVEDCKGARTRVSINKIKQVEAIYGIKIDIITRAKRT